MNNVYIMEVDNYLDYGVIKNPEVDDDTSFLRGQIIHEELPPLIFEVNFPRGENLPNFLGDEIPLVSKALLRRLQAAGIDNFQVFPATLVNSQTGQAWDDFLAFNVIGLIKAANLDHSDFDVLMEGGDCDQVPALLAFREIALDRAKVPDTIMMFRMAESPCTLVIHEHLLNVMLKNKPEGGWGIDIIDVDMI